MKKYLFSIAAICAALTFASCSSSNDDNNGGGDSDSKYKDQSYGAKAVTDCATLVTNLESANEVIGRASLSAEQQTYLQATIANLVDNVIVPTYTELANKTEALEKDLNGLNVNTIKQTDIDAACDAFGEARVLWEQSEAFLGGAASDFSIDPTIDSWPLSRTLLHNYLSSGEMNEDMLDDSSILGFHALEFMLFRNGQPRKVAEFQGKDTYSGFTDIDGSKELVYAQQVCKLLKERTFQLQVAWEGETTANASRVAVVKASKDNLEYTTEKGLSYGDDLKGAGTNSKSRYATIKDAIAQILSDEEGSAAAIANEVGTAKIANPFSKGQISYVESPYSYRSIKDFQDNIRSVRNVWLGTRDGNTSSSVKSFYNFFNSLQSATNTAVVNGYTNAINSIGNMPSPFVKYCCTVWNKEFSEEEYEGEEE